MEEWTVNDTRWRFLSQHLTQNKNPKLVDSMSIATMKHSCPKRFFRKLSGQSQQE